jgi:hypothetical protein
MQLKNKCALGLRASGLSHDTIVHVLPSASKPILPHSHKVEVDPSHRC